MMVKQRLPRLILTASLAAVLMFPAAAECFNFAGARPLFWGGLAEAVERFGEINGVPAHTAAGGCSEAVTGIRSGHLEIGGICCLVDESLSDFKVHPVAMDAITIIVHPSNPVANLSLDQVRGIFHGEITDWSQVGGAQGSIVPVFRDHCDYKNEIFKKEVIESREKLADSALVVSTIASSMDYVSKYPMAIGHVSSVFSMNESSLRVVSVNGAAPTSENILSGKYPLSRTLILITRKDPPDVVKRFIEFLKSDEGRRILSKRLTPVPDEKR